MYIDAHAHVDWLSHRGLDIDDEIKKAKNAGLTAIIQSIDQFSNNFQNIELARKYENFIFPLVGVHPQQAHNAPEDWESQIEKLIQENRDLVTGIGEIGIDLHYPETKETKNLQIETFEKCLNIALNHNLPVQIHSWDSFSEAFSVLKKFKGKIRGMIHSFSYGPDEAKKFVSELDFYISFTGSITYHKNVHLVDTLKAIPNDKIICETDAPFMPPQGFRGNPNSPWMVSEVYKFVSENLRIGSGMIYENTKDLFLGHSGCRAAGKIV